MPKSSMRETIHQHGQDEHAQRAEPERRQPDRAQQVLRALAEAGEKLHRQQVRESP